MTWSSWISNHVSIVRDEAGRPLYRDGNIRDITARKQVEQEREQLWRRSEAARQRMEEVLHLIAHDLRQPLTASRGYLQLLPRSLLERGDQQRVRSSVEPILPHRFRGVMG